jgi:tetratricopeptide (TPR) repeat protein
MSKPGLPNDGTPSPGQPFRIEPTQFDFELAFYSGILKHHPDYVDVLRVVGSLLALKGMTSEGLKIDRRLTRLRPSDPLAHYNLACTYARLNQANQSVKALRRAVELGYRDFRYIAEDADLDPIRTDPRYRKLMKEYEAS